MRKLKLYLDTSVISHLDAADTPEKMADTLRLWEMILSGEYSVAWSDVTVAEVEDCPEPKLSKLRTHMAEVDAELIPVNDAVTALASQFIGMGILTPKSLSDCQHIASAMTAGCDVIVSWNFKHIVNPKTVRGVKVVSVVAHVPDVMIFTPSAMIGGTEDDP
jgi:predicted nucleic acid-binding protein